jgi:hypothetical protein
MVGVSMAVNHATNAVWSQGGAHVKVFDDPCAHVKNYEVVALYHDSSPVSVLHRRVYRWPAWIEWLLGSYQTRISRAVEAMKREALWRLRVEAERGTSQ